VSTTCRFNHETGDYRTPDGDPCKTDDYGDPTFHCTARRSCSNHVGRNELTCARCIGRTRRDIRQIVERAPLLLAAAIESGVDSEAADLAGPAADPVAWMWHRLASVDRLSDLPTDDDEPHPYTVLATWDMMIREDYGHPSDVPVTVTNAGAYLDSHLARIAHDPNQDFGLFAREIRNCRNRLELVLRTASFNHRGAPCPDCTSEETGVGPRLVREFGHWCEDEDCERLHYADDREDRWVCPRDRDHWWDHETYTRWVEERRKARA
jgi:hypothetical protein